MNYSAERIRGIVEMTDSTIANILPKAYERGTLASELLNYCIFLSAANGSINMDEASFMGEALYGQKLHPQAIADEIDFSTLFEKILYEDPLSLSCAVGVDNYLGEAAFKRKGLSPLSDQIVDICNTLGEVMIEMDDGDKKLVREAKDSYINHLKQYIIIHRDFF